MLLSWAMAHSRPGLDADRAHLLHPLHHPSSYPQARIWVEGQGAVIKDSTGREYLDGLAGLWNVTVGHGRKELATAAYDQMATLAYCSSYAGSTNYPAIALAERLSEIAYPSINTFFFTSGVAAANQLEAAILREGADTVAAFIAEPVQGAGGVIVPPPDYFPRIREICNRHDVLLIADEVITGFGRTGKWFGLEHYGIEPDIMQFAKGITSGYIPLGGIGVSDAIREVINGVAPAKRWMHAYTYSGHPTCCAVALKNLEILRDEGLVERAARLGEQLAERLQRLAGLDGVGHVRSLGLIGAVEIVADKATKALHPPEAQMASRLTDAMLERGLLTRVALDCICISPPLVISEAQLDRVVEIIAEAVPAALATARA